MLRNAWAACMIQGAIDCLAWRQEGNHYSQDPKLGTIVHLLACQPCGRQGTEPGWEHLVIFVTVNEVQKW